MKEECFILFFISCIERRFLDGLFCFSGVVPKSKSKVAEEGALWPDAAGPDAFLHCLRAATANSARELRTGNKYGKTHKNICSTKAQRVAVV